MAVGARGADRSDGLVASRYAGAAYLIASGDMRTADAADGTADGIMDIAIGSNALGTRAASAYFLSGTELRIADATDGVQDGVIDLEIVDSVANSWKIVGESDAWGWSGLSIRGASDVNGDGLGDLFLSPATYEYGEQAAWFLSGGDLPLLDRADGKENGIIHLDHVHR